MPKANASAAKVQSSKSMISEASTLKPTEPQSVIAEALDIHAAVDGELAETLPPRKRIDAQLSRLMDAANMVHIVAKAIKDEQACAEAHGVLSIAQDTLYDVNSEIECELRDWQPPGDDNAAPRSGQGNSGTVAESTPAGARDWRDMAQARGSIADMILSQPGGAEEALRRLEAGATLAQVCGVESAPEDAIPEAIRRHLLEQQQRAVEIQEILQMLADGTDEGASVAAGCARLARALNVGLDSHTLGKVLEGQAPGGSEEVAS